MVDDNNPTPVSSSGGIRDLAEQLCGLLDATPNLPSSVRVCMVDLTSAIERSKYPEAATAMTGGE